MTDMNGKLNLILAPQLVDQSHLFPSKQDGMFNYDLTAKPKTTRQIKWGFYKFAGKFLAEVKIPSSTHQLIWAREANFQIKFPGFKFKRTRT